MVNVRNHQIESDTNNSSFNIPNADSRFTRNALSCFLPEGLLTRHIAIDVPAACAAEYEKFFVIASKLAGFHDVEGKPEGSGNDRHGPAESILIRMESNWILSQADGIWSCTTTAGEIA